MDSDLPVTNSFPLVPCDSTSTFDKVQTNDAQIVHFSLQMVGEAWNQARSIDDIGKCVLLTCKMIEKRRDILGFPRGYKNNSAKDDYIYPID